MKFLEIEHKYNASDIPLSVFTKFCKERDPMAYVCASGYDYFFSHKSDANAFCRYRHGADMNQLTFKRKTTEANNRVRTEHNIDLAPNMRRTQIEAFLKEFGYSYNTEIFKSCFVYKYSYYTLVYYICYDADMTELGRFIEIEMSEEKNWSNGEAEAELVILEKLCKPLGILPQARIRRSLFEMFRREASEE